MGCGCFVGEVNIQVFRIQWPFLLGIALTIIEICAFQPQVRLSQKSRVQWVNMAPWLPFMTLSCVCFDMEGHVIQLILMQ